MGTIAKQHTFEEHVDVNSTMTVGVASSGSYVSTGNAKLGGVEKRRWDAADLAEPAEYEPDIAGKHIIRVSVVFSDDDVVTALVTVSTEHETRTLELPGKVGDIGEAAFIVVAA